MNISNLFNNIIPISSALLSLFGSFAVYCISQKITSSKSKGKRDSEIIIKLNDKEIEIKGYSEKEVLDIIKKLNDKDADNLQEEES